MSPAADEGQAITAEGLDALKAELAELEGPAREALSKRIQAARAEGDLKENAEYHVAKEDQAHLETKILRLRERLRRAVVVEADHDAQTVAFGSTVTVTDLEAGREQRFTIVGPTEADLSAGRLSSESPVATALMGAAPGDVVEVQTPRGARRWRVDRLGAGE
ncbi:MAG TPA: transcription elongation factor GreA [Solirubrobacteraceae bacterium]|nr:transcription elongation factor GreA [Solirubrobacteraceae bacterium]